MSKRLYNVLSALVSKYNNAIERDGIIDKGAGTIAGDFTSIGSWIKSNYIIKKWITARMEASSSGYFGTAAFSIFAYISSPSYGYGFLISDSDKVIVYFRLSGGTFYWHQPALTKVS